MLHWLGENPPSSLNAGSSYFCARDHDIAEFSGDTFFLSWHKTNFQAVLKMARRQNHCNPRCREDIQLPPGVWQRPPSIATRIPHGVAVSFVLGAAASLQKQKKNKQKEPTHTSLPLFYFCTVGLVYIGIAHRHNESLNIPKMTPHPRKLLQHLVTSVFLPADFTGNARFHKIRKICEIVNSVDPCK